MSDMSEVLKKKDPPITVLLIDDQAIIGEAVRRICASQPDIHFHFVNDPMQAIAKAREVHPTVILQDLVMPGVDGLDLVTQFRAESTTALVPLVVLSSKEEGQTKAEAFARGANDYMVKLPRTRSRSSRACATTRAATSRSCSATPLTRRWRPNSVKLRSTFGAFCPHRSTFLRFVRAGSSRHLPRLVEIVSDIACWMRATSHSG